MIKYLAVAAIAAFACAAAQADDTNGFGFDASRLAPIDATTAGGLGSDLLLDTTFAADGMAGVWPPVDSTWSATVDAVRVFPWVKTIHLPTTPPVSYAAHGGYYVIGKQKSVAGDGWRIWITRYTLDGIIDASFGTNGWIFNTSNNTGVADAQVVGNKAYVLADVDFGGLPLTIVRCIELDTPTGSSCFSGFAGFLPFTVTSAGPRTAVHGQRLAYDARYGLFVAARITNANRGEELGVARIDADTGALNHAFGGDGYNIGLPNWANEPDAAVAVNALAVTPEGTPGGTRVYVVGQISRSSVDSDGFVLGLGPSNGATQAGWNWNDRTFYYESDNRNPDADALTAIAIQRNGRIVVAGWSATDDANTKPLMMARRNADGSADTTFCADSGYINSTNVCLVDPPASGGIIGQTWAYKPGSIPIAIIERRQNRDLVVVQRFKDSGYPAFGPPAGSQPYNRVRTQVQQFSSNGNVLHAELSIDFTDLNGDADWSRPFAGWSGGTGLWADGDNGGVGEEVIAIVGTRKWTASNYFGTISHLKSNDSIFADPFGGPHGD